MTYESREQTTNILLVSYPRCGTNYFVHDILGKSPYFVYLGELFHYIPQLYPWDYRSKFIDDTAFKSAIAEDPIMVFKQALGDMANQQTTCSITKLFPSHLEEAAIRKIASQFQVVIILWRNPLYSFLSDALAMEINEWAHLSTENIHTRWNLRSFIDTTRTNLQFIDDTGRLFEEVNRPVLELNYNTILNVELSATFKQFGIDLPRDSSLSTEANDLIFKKQDHRSALNRLQEKDRAKVEYDLKALGLLDLLTENCTLDRSEILSRINSI